MAERGEELSERELAVLELLVGGGTNREIARDLDISHNTVKVHLRNVFTKLGVSSRTEASTVALQLGLVTVPGVEAVAPPSEPVVQPEAAAPAVPRSSPLSEDPQLATLPAVPLTRRPWFLASLVLIITLLAIFLVGPRLLNGEAGQGETTEATAAPFQETRLEETNWFVSAEMPQERAAMALAAVGLDLYQIGGEVPAGVTNLVSVYETKSGVWRAAAPKPTAVAETSAAVLFGEIYVPGGRLADGRPTAVVEVYSPANDAWRPVNALPEPLSGSLVVAGGGMLYVVGGWDGDAFTDAAFAYDPSSDAWQPLPPMSQARGRAAGGLLNNRLYVVGGFDGELELAGCEYFDLAESAWFTCPPMQFARAGAGAAALSNNHLYVIGGGMQEAVLLGEVFDTGKDAWTTLEMPMLPEGASWRDLGVASVETRIYAMGGRLDGDLITASYVYMPFSHRTYLPAVGGDN